MPALIKDGPVWTLDLGTTENRFSPDFLSEVDASLDEIATSTEPAVLLTTGTGKFFTNGLDLEWIMANPSEMSSYVDRIHSMFAKFLTLPVATVAAINGHAFGGGAMLAIAHDYRVMRDDRGYFCFPEVDILIPFTAGMNALIVAKTTPQTQVASMTTGHRFGGAEAVAAGLADEAVSMDQLRGAAEAKVAHLAGKDRRTLGRIKQVLYAPAVEALLTPQAADLSL